MNTIQLQLQPFSWDTIDESGNNSTTCIHCWSFDRDNKPHLLRIEDYPASCYLELPRKIDGHLVEWHEKDIDRYMLHLSKKIREGPPIKYTLCWKEKLYYYKRVKTPMIHVLWNNLQDMRRCRRFVGRTVTFVGKGKGKVTMWEDKVPQIRKFFTAVSIEASQWFQVKAVKVPQEEKISSLEEEYIASWTSISPLCTQETKDWLCSPLVLSYDIETYSKNHKAFPSALNASDVCFLISVITQQVGKPETRKRYALIYGHCDDIPGVEVVRTKSEVDCILYFTKLVKELNPDITIGYNHHGFDNNYMNLRLERLGLDWGEIGRINGEKTEIKSRTWASAAYGHNEVSILEMSGRISIDMLSVIKRDHKLNQYNLETVANYFLGRGKHPVTAQDMFRAFEESTLAKKSGDPERIRAATEEMTRVTRYCVEDSEITLDLFEKLHVWIASIELSNIVGVSIMDLYTRGQQVRCHSKIYHEAHKEGYVIDHKDPLNIVFNGGAVKKPVLGVEDEVPCYDFNSLYPSVMIEDNIDHTTYVPDHLAHLVKDEDCNIVEFDQLERPKVQSDQVNKEDFDLDPEIEKDGKLVHRKIRFVKKSKREGIIPKILAYLIDERKKVKREIGSLIRAKKEGQDVDEVELVRLDKKQLALKISANSYFGFTGAYIGKLPLIEAAMATTGRGRESIKKCETYLEEKYGAYIKYGDTDSTMPKFTHLGDKTWEERYAFYKGMEEELSSLFPGRLVLEMEKVMRIICFAPKMYAYLPYDKDGNLPNSMNEIISKGIVLARRDGTPWVREHYRKIIFNILHCFSGWSDELVESMTSSFRLIVEAIDEIRSGLVDWRDLAKINELGSNYKNPNYFMNVLAQHLQRIGRPAQPGDRLQYIVCDIPGETTVGKKLRTVDEYLDYQGTKEELKIDVNYYLENALQKKLDPLFGVGYNTLLPCMQGVGYQPLGRKHFVGIDQPVRMIARMLEDGHDIDDLVTWFAETARNIDWEKALEEPKTPPKRKIKITYLFLD